MRTWFSITASAAGTVISIHDEIGAGGISAAAFNAEFEKFKGRVVNVEINSPGGSVFDGFAIYNMLKASGKTINVKVVGVAASIASVIAMAGTKISMPANSMIMVHSPTGAVKGSAEAMEAMADALRKIKSSMVGLYMKRTGRSEGDITDMLARDTWMSAAEAKQAGFADEVIDEINATASFDLNQLPENARAVFQARVPEPAIADQITALAKAEGLEAYAPGWVLKFKDMAEAKAGIREAGEIKALCLVVREPGKVDAYIKAGKTLAQVRTEMIAERAAADQHIDTARPAAAELTSQALNEASRQVYAKRSAKS
jgi:ATP-dependent Clp protease protease subunit